MILPPSCAAASACATLRLPLRQLVSTHAFTILRRVSCGLLYKYIESEDGDGRAIWFFLLWGQVKMGVLAEPLGTPTPSSLP
jgi:hypothetical protein